MNYRGWLERTWVGDRATLARELHERWPEGLEKDNDAEALANRLGATDKGKSPTKWWADHDALIPPLAEILRRPESQVRAWIEHTTHVKAGPWLAPGLQSVTGARVDEPPYDLWPGSVSEWVEQVEGSQAESLRAWLTFEPGVAGDWLKEWFEVRGWHVLRAATWSEAEKQLKPRSRHVVHLTGTRPADLTPPSPRSRATICVLANYTPNWSSRATEATGGNRWQAPRVAVHDGWAILDWARRPDPRACLEWFQKLCRPERALDDGEVSAVVRELGELATPGEILARLDVSRDEDRVAAMLARRDEAAMDDLIAIEREAARRGIGHRRSRATWIDLVKRPASADETLADVRRYLAKNDIPRAKRLAEDRPAAVVERLTERGVLQPCTEGDAPSGTWQVWPRWLGAALASRAVEELARRNDTAGDALLANEEGCTAAMANLGRIVASSDWDQVLVLLRTDLQTPAGVATVEATALALGHGILDGVDVPPEIAAGATKALSAVRRRTGGAGLLAHGDGFVSHDAFTLADWALGQRAASEDPRFGPWTAGVVQEAEHLSAVRSLDAALDRWSAGSEHHRSSDEHSSFGALARRVMRLGTMLFDRCGPVVVAENDQRGLWSFQVPAVLVAASRGQDMLPGRTPDDVLRAQVPGVDISALAAEGEKLWGSGNADALKDTERVGRATMALMMRRLAEGSPEALARDRAIRAILEAASSRFSLVKAEIEASGASPLIAIRWLWARWNEQAAHGHTVPPVSLLSEHDLGDARIVWGAAPEVVSRAIWERASRESAFWDVLPAAGWRAWAEAGNDVAVGWQRMPSEVLMSLLGSGLPVAGYSTAWHRLSAEVLAWLLPQLRPDLASGSPARRCLDATPSILVADLLARAPTGGLPADWLQEVVRARVDGWRGAWELLTRPADARRVPT